MHKKLEAELVSLAHSILELKNNDVTILHKKAHFIYEKLTVLKFVEENLNSLENIDEVENLKEEQVAPKIIEDIITEETTIVKTVESIIEEAKENFEFNQIEDIYIFLLYLFSLQLLKKNADMLRMFLMYLHYFL